MSLKDMMKDKGVSALASLPSRGAALATGAPAARPVTSPGAQAVMQPMIDELRSRAQRAEAHAQDLEQQLGEWAGAQAARRIDPGQIRASRWANRHELAFATPEFEELKAEIAEAGGNVQPIKVRPVAPEDGAPRFEIVFGHRRHRACLELGLPVLALVDELEEAALFVEMDRENRGRKDLSAWEQGMMYRRALDAGLFQSLRRMAAALGADPSNVSKAIQLASLPEDVVRAFPSPLDLQFRWLAPLSQAIERDPAGVLARARALAALQPRPAAKDVLDRLASAGSAPTAAPVREVCRGDRPVGAWEKDARGGLTLKLKKGALDPKDEAKLMDLVAKFFG